MSILLLVSATETQAVWSRKTGAAEIHRAGCSALNKANGKRFAEWIKVDAEQLKDLQERGYPVKQCRCTK